MLTMVERKPTSDRILTSDRDTPTPIEPSMILATSDSVVKLADWLETSTTQYRLNHKGSRQCDEAP